MKQVEHVSRYTERVMGLPGDRAEVLRALQWHFSKRRRKPAHLEAPKKSAATLDELAEPPPSAPIPPESVPGWEQDAACSCGCGYADAPARPLWERATHDEP